MQLKTSQCPPLSGAPVVLVVDDDDVLRGALTSLLRSVGYRVHAFASPVQMLAHPQAAGASCLLLDVRLQGYSGFDVQLQMAESGMGMPIIFMTGHGDVPMSVRAMKAGAVDFFAKPFNHQQLLDAVASAVTQYQQMQEKSRQLQCLHARYEGLTPREKQVMQGVVKGLLNKQIAGDLEISEITVKLHRASMMRKMRVPSLADLVRAGHQLQLA